MVDPSLTRAPWPSTCCWPLRHWEFDRFERAQRAREWAYAFPPQAAERRVGLMGLGEPVRGGPRARRARLPGARLEPHPEGARRRRRPGRSELHAFLHRADILVCLLLTADTVGILDAATFAELPHGACVINVARGQHLVENDLIEALDPGILGGATLDVFREEPLPRGSPLWDHPKADAARRQLLGAGDRRRRRGGEHPPGLGGRAPPAPGRPRARVPTRRPRPTGIGVMPGPSSTAGLSGS